MGLINVMYSIVEDFLFYKFFSSSLWTALHLTKKISILAKATTTAHCDVIKGVALRAVLGKQPVCQCTREKKNENNITLKQNAGESPHACATILISFAAVTWNADIFRFVWLGLGLRRDVKCSSAAAGLHHLKIDPENWCASSARAMHTRPKVN